MSGHNIDAISHNMDIKRFVHVNKNIKEVGREIMMDYSLVGSTSILSMSNWVGMRQNEKTVEIAALVEDSSI